MKHRLSASTQTKRYRSDALRSQAALRCVILAVAAFALTGCNSNQGVNPSSRPASEVFAGRYTDYNPYDPTSYAQNQTGRGGGGH